MAVPRALGGMLGLFLGLGPLAGAAEEPPAGSVVDDFVQATQARLQVLLSRTLTMVRRDRPQWLVEQDRGVPDPGAPPSETAAQLVVQEHRRDGADLLTLRYPLPSRGSLRSYAGAGLNRAVYFADGGGAPVLLTRRNRERSLGPAAEVGAELQVSEQLRVHAGLRWADLDDDAILLRNGDGLAGADPLAVGVSIAWRFR